MKKVRCDKCHDIDCAWEIELKGNEFHIYCLNCGEQTLLCEHNGKTGEWKIEEEVIDGR